MKEKRAFLEVYTKNVNIISIEVCLTTSERMNEGCRTSPMFNGGAAQSLVRLRAEPSDRTLFLLFAFFSNATHSLFPFAAKRLSNLC